MRKALLSIAIIIAMLAPIIISAPTIRAVDVNSGNGDVSNICAQPGAATSAYCQDTTNPTNKVYGKNGVLITTSYIISIIAGVAAIIIIIISGIRFMVSGGDSNSVASARNSIIYAVVGLIVIAAAESIFLLVMNNI